MLIRSLLYYSQTALMNFKDASVKLSAQNLAVPTAKAKSNNF